jgi:hypothetical protein
MTEGGLRDPASRGRCPDIHEKGLKMRHSLLLLTTALLSPVAVAAQDQGKAFPVRYDQDADKDIDDAFDEAFQVPLDSTTEMKAERTIDDATYSFKPIALRPIGNDLWALLSIGSQQDAGHVSSGINAIHYLHAGEGGWKRVGEWLDVGAAGTFGNGATSWGFTKALGKNPYMITSGGGVWQGCAVSSAVVTELAPGGPVDRGAFIDSMSSGAGTGQKEQEYEGSIVAAVPDKSFTVAYTGTRAVKQQYVLKAGKYELVGKEEIPGC